MLRQTRWRGAGGKLLAAGGVICAVFLGGCAPKAIGPNGAINLDALKLQAERGDSNAAVLLGEIYSAGIKTPQDYGEAKTWFQFAFDHGNMAGEFNLGLLYLTGHGTPLDTAAALRCFHDAADHGFAPAKMELGALYVEGKGVPQDDAEGARWMRSAAIDGFAPAQILLSFMYSSGRGVEPDDGIAYEWASLAAVHLPPASQPVVSKIRDNIAKELPPDVLTTAQAAATQWKPGSDVASPFPAGAGPRPARMRGMGSGFIIGKNGEIATDFHVVPNCRDVRVKDSSGKFDVVTHVVAADKTADLALLQGGGFGTPLKLRAKEPILGETIVTFGFPLGTLLSTTGNLTNGSVSSPSGMQGSDQSFQISAPVQAGNSGGPVVDQSGLLIGIVVSKLNAIAVAAVTGDLAQNVNFATQARLLRSLMDSKGIAYETAGTAPARTNTELADLLQKSTVKVECWR